jgi:hypothetical protein
LKSPVGYKNGILPDDESGLEDDYQEMQQSITPNNSGSGVHMMSSASNQKNSLGEIFKIKKCTKTAEKSDRKVTYDHPRQILNQPKRRILHLDSSSNILHESSDTLNPIIDDILPSLEEEVQSPQNQNIVQSKILNQSQMQNLFAKKNDQVSRILASEKLALSKILSNTDLIQTQKIPENVKETISFHNSGAG